MVRCPRLKTLQRIEQAEGMPAGEALRVLYVDQLMTTRELSARWKMGSHTIGALLSQFGLARSNSESVAVQWVRSPDRKPDMAGLDRYRAESGNFWRGRTKDLDERQRQKSEKLRQSTSFHRPEVRQLAIRNKLAKDHACRSRHVNYRTPPTRREQILIDWLRGRGFTVVHNHAIGLRWVDVWLPDFNLGVEAFNPGNTQIGGWARHREICLTGARLVYISNAYIDRGYFSQLHQAILSPEVFQLDPASHRENTVVWGCRKAAAVWRDYPQEMTVERVYVNKINELRFARPADHNIARA